MCVLWLAALLSVAQAAASPRGADTLAVARGGVCGVHRQLDRRIHRGYEGWERLIPTHVKVQYAGGMGVVSAGVGWDYGRRCRWETEVMTGLLPKAYSDRTHATFTVRQNYIPWSISLGNRLALEPFACGIYVNMISGQLLRLHLAPAFLRIRGAAHDVAATGRFGAARRDAVLRACGQRPGYHCQVR